MLEILKRFLGSANLDIQLKGSILGLSGDPQINEVSVRPFPSTQYIQEDDYKYIREQAKNCLIIYFGLKPKKDEEAFGMMQSDFVRYVV